MIKNPIWFDVSPIEFASSRWKNCTIGHLGIEMVEAGSDFLKARMPVDERTRQPSGILHGGASVVLAESLASCACAFTLDRSKQHCVGVEINANHIRSVTERRICHGGHYPIAYWPHDPDLADHDHRSARSTRLCVKDYHGDSG